MPDTAPRPTAEVLRDSATRFMQRILSPQEAALEAAVRRAQIDLARAASDHRPELEGTGHYETLRGLLHRADSLMELADTIDITPVDLIPTDRKAWEAPETATFLGRLSKGTAQFLGQAGDWLKDAGYRIESGRCRAEATQLYAEAGAILGGLFTADTHYPTWAAEPMGNLRTALEALADYRLAHGGETNTERLRARMQALYTQFGATVTRENVNSSIDSAGSQVREGFIEFTAWGLQTFGSFAVFIGLVSLSIFVVPPWGAVLVAGLVYTWLRHRPEIEERATGLRTSGTSIPHPDDTIHQAP